TKNFLTLMLLAIGTPMLLMGDEVRRSQGGNNNGYCQDNEASWFDWGLVEKHADIHRFAKKMIALRMNRDLPSERADMTLSELLREHRVEGHGVRLTAPDWPPDSHTVAATARLLGYRLLLHLIVNAYWEPLDFELPPVGDLSGSWRRCIDTYLDSPYDICEFADAPQMRGLLYRAQPRSVVLLIASFDLSNADGS